MTFDEVNKLLRSELSAVETYQQALEKERQKFGHKTEFQQLNAIPLKGFYRIRPGQPGFAIPVFENNGQLVVQHVGTGGTIDGFLPCDLDVDQLLPVPKDIGAEPLYSRVGTEPLYGFQNLDGTLIYGSRDKLLLLLHPVSAQLADRPFLSLEIAQFLEDEVLINENRARTQSLLRRHARDPIKFERFIDTELTARSVPEAAKWSRTIDYLLFFVLFFVFLGGYHIHFILTAGEWDFWVDLEDRRLWVTVTPIMAITFCAVVQYMLWEKFRLPIGATDVISYQYVRTGPRSISGW